MPEPTRWQRWKKTHPMRQLLFGLGWMLMLLSPAVGLLPGPGGIFLLAAGVALVLETSVWARRVYVRLKRRWPRVGGWMDRILRRTSARRRRERDRERSGGALAAAAAAD